MKVELEGLHDLGVLQIGASRSMVGWARMEVTLPKGRTAWEVDFRVELPDSGPARVRTVEYSCKGIPKRVRERLDLEAIRAECARAMAERGFDAMRRWRADWEKAQYKIARQQAMAVYERAASGALKLGLEPQVLEDALRELVAKRVMEA